MTASIPVAWGEKQCLKDVWRGAGSGASPPHTRRRQYSASARSGVGGGGGGCVLQPAVIGKADAGGGAVEGPVGAAGGPRVMRGPGSALLGRGRQRTPACGPLCRLEAV